MAAAGARLFGKLFGNAISEAVAFGAGYALGPVLGPPVELIRQSAWQAYPDRIPDVAALATGVAEGKLDTSEAHDWATKNGFGATAFDALVTIARSGPGVSAAYELWRRDVISDAKFKQAVELEGIAAEWVTDLAAIKTRLLTPGELAAAIHRGLVPNPDILLGEQPSGPRNVASYPVQPIDAVAEAEGSGYDKERLAVLVGLQGLPMGTHEAAEAYFRGVITKGDYIAAFNESNSRNEWAEAVLEYSRQIPTARDYIENALRGYRTLAEAQAGAARHGMSADDARLIFQNSGRPLNLHQITQALAWGAKYNPQPGDDPDPYMNSVLIGSVTPAYYEMQDALKYTLPGYFVVKAMLANKTLTVDEAATIFKRQAWPPDLAEQAAAALEGSGAGTKADPYVLKAEGQLWTSLHKDYVKTGLTRAQVEPGLTKLVPEADTRTTIFGLWETEREIAAEKPPAS